MWEMDVFFSDQYWAKKMCLKAIDENVVCEAKYTDDITGVACFYLNIDNYERHKKVIQFFIENNLVKKTKAGKFANIAFKLDRQTKTKKYKPKKHLDINNIMFYNSYNYQNDKQLEFEVLLQLLKQTL